MKRICIIIIAMSSLFWDNGTYCADGNSISLNGTWKFKIGDNPEWSQPAFPDSQWDFIGVPQIWEDAGFPNYDGYAWYRKKFYIPVEWQNEKYVNLKNHLYLKPGKIDDADQTFFNGRLIGETGASFPYHSCQWDVPRLYRIPLNLVRWGGENYIAIRVYDYAGKGGIYSGEIALLPPTQIDYIKIQVNVNSADHIFQAYEKVKLAAILENNSFDLLEGSLTWDIVADDKRKTDQFTLPIRLDIGKSLKREKTFRLKKPGVYNIYTNFIKQGKTFFHSVQTIGYDVENIKPKLTRRRDFDEFWERTRAQLSHIPMQAEIERVDSLCTETQNVYSARILSFDNIYIYGWYSVPKRDGPFPAILELPCYARQMPPLLDDSYRNFAVLALDIRGHGKSREEINPGFPGYLVRNIDNKEKYIYRGAYMDCIRGIDFLYSRPEVDTARIAICGKHQGGALALATAALDPRIKLAAAYSPFLAFFQKAVKLALWPYHEIVQYIIEHPSQKRNVYRNLSYFDVLNLASRVQCPVFMGISLKDPICPPSTCFAVFNQINGKKEYEAHPTADYAVDSTFNTNSKINWIKKHFGME